MTEQAATSAQAEKSLKKIDKADLALPGQSKMDKALIDRAVEDLNAMYTAKGLELARAMGEYVLENFFGGDLTNLQKDQSHVSWRPSDCICTAQAFGSSNARPRFNAIDLNWSEVPGALARRPPLR